MVLQLDECSIEYLDNAIRFSGKLERSNYSELSEFLSNADMQTSRDSMVLDLIKLDFLNSSGIRAIAVYLMETSKKIKLRLNDLTWQRVGIVPLTKIRPENFITVEK